ncbi:MAG: leucyl/phenylalanyl-tRNA--protein transferase [Cardiobacteriaceae bacterium]|nr:leucyl/phenylalanyl-tRNA--protein transferase [Cardiobacteriaceae bacterium]
MSNPYRFPPVEAANEDGLLAIGGDLAPERVFAAHAHGIFPWYNPGEDILWWAPPLRAILPVADFHASRSLKKLARRENYRFSADAAFARVIRACRREDSWLDEHMIAAYSALHAQGRAHSIEVWAGDALAGGVYGVALEHIFCAESMFSARASASTLALAVLARHLQNLGITLIDTQFLTEHLHRLGARNIPRPRYQQYLSNHPDRHRGTWYLAPEHAHSRALWAAQTTS